MGGESAELDLDLRHGHFLTAKVAATIIEDLVSRKLLVTVVCGEETSTQVQLVFIDALEREGLMDAVLARIDRPDGRTVADPTVDDEHRPILLAVSDKGPQMTSGSTREFMALHAIAVHFGRPGTTHRPGLRNVLRASQGRIPTLVEDHRAGGAARRA